MAAVTCTFTGAENTDLADYSAVGECSFTKNSASTGQMVLDNANRGKSVNAALSWYSIDEIDATDRGYIQAEFTIVSNANWIALLAAASTTAHTGYALRYATGAWRLYRVNAGSATEIAYYTQALTVGNTYTVKLERRGQELLVWVDSALRIISLCPTLTTGRFGVEGIGNYNNVTGWRIDNLTADTLATDGVGTNITITSPQRGQVIPKGTGGRADIVITGTYTGTPTSIEARWKGGAWTTIVASPSGGTFTGTLSNQLKGQGTLEVRHTDNTANSASQEYVGIGLVLVCCGQSNMVGQAIGASIHVSAITTNYVGCVFGNDNAWHLCGDAYDNNYSQVDAVSSDTGGQAFVIRMVNAMMETLECPIALIPCAKGATVINSWVPGANHLDRTTLYGSANYRIGLAGGAHLVLWYQGETDATGGTTQANYNSRLDSVANGFQADRAIKTMAGLLHNFSAASDAAIEVIRDAVEEAAGDNSNVVLGPDLWSLTDDGDMFHFLTAATLASAGEAWATRLLDYLPPDVSAPTVTTTAASVVSPFRINCGGNVTSDGGATCTERGICWNTTGTPTTGDDTIEAFEAGAGEYAANMFYLLPNTTYYIRAYAINSVGTSYGSQVVATTDDTGGFGYHGSVAGVTGSFGFHGSNN